MAGHPLHEEFVDQLDEVRARARRRWRRRSLDAYAYLVRGPQVMFGLQAASAVAGSPPQATLTTLEGSDLVVQLDAAGVRVVSGGGAKDGLVCDSLNSLLLNASPGFVAKFNESLAAQLRLAVEQQEREQPEDWPEEEEGGVGR